MRFLWAVLCIFCVLFLLVSPAQLKGVCYVHIGKSGGNSIVRGLKKMMDLGIIGSSVQIHSTHDRSSLDRTYEIGGMEYTWTNLGGPLNKNIQQCSILSQMLIWVRDPVSRLISLWDMHWETHWHQKVDLNTLILSMVELEKKNGTGLSRLFKTFNSIPHAVTDIAFYLGDSKIFLREDRTLANRSENCQKILLGFSNNTFVGRTEHMLADWDRFMNQTIGVQVQLTLPHTHASLNQRKRLSPTSVGFLRLFYHQDYKCIQDMVDFGWLGVDYFDEITRLDKVYMY